MEDQVLKFKCRLSFYHRIAAVKNACKSPCQEYINNEKDLIQKNLCTQILDLDNFQKKKKTFPPKLSNEPFKKWRLFMKIVMEVQENDIFLACLILKLVCFSSVFNVTFTLK